MGENRNIRDLTTLGESQRESRVMTRQRCGGSESKKTAELFLIKFSKLNIYDKSV